MMRKFVFAALAMAVSLAHVGSARAGAVQYLQMGVVNALQDNNWESYFPAAGNATGNILIGDRFLGVIQIESIEAPEGVEVYRPGGGQETITAVFAIEAARIETTADFTNVYFKPLETTNWSAEFGLNLPDPVNPNTMAVFFDDQASPFNNAIGAGGNLQTSIDSYTGTNRIWEMGFAGGDFQDGVSDLGEFFVATGSVGTDTIGADLASIRNIINLGLLERFAGPPLLPHTYLSTDAAAEPRALQAGVTFASAAHLQAIGSISSAPNSAWDFRTDTNLYVYPVPEPSSLAVFAIGAVGGGVVALRNRRRKAVQQA